MAKRVTYMVLVLSTIFSIVAGSAIPHHHHHGDESVICFADDLHEEEPADGCACAADGHHTTDGSCCGVRTNLVAHFGDSRKEELQCGCDSDHLFHGGHLYIILASLTENLFPANILPERELEYPPYSNPYHSVLTRGRIGLRAPPVV